MSGADDPGALDPGALDPGALGRELVKLRIEAERLRRSAAASEAGRLALVERLEALHALNERIERLDAERADAERRAAMAAAELDAVRRSTSWRLTRPWRAVGRRLRR